MEKLLKTKIKGNMSIYFILLYLFFIYITYNTPLTGDDWTWGTEIGEGRFERAFHDYNGRYLSNIFELVFVRVDIIRYLTVALFSALLVFIIGKITDYQNNPITLMLSFVLIVLMPVRIFAQTMGWTAGFINYVPSVALLLLFIYIVRNIYSDTAPIYRKYTWLLMIPLGLLSQLIVEHVTIFTVMTAAWVVAYTFWKHKKVYLVHISYLVSALIGSIIMFSNSAYMNVVTGNDAYRTVKNDAIAQMGLFEKIYFVYSESIYVFMFIENSLINIILGVLALILMMRLKTLTGWLRFAAKPALIFIITSAIAYLLIIRPMAGPAFIGDYTNDFEALLYLFYFIGISLAIALSVKDSAFKARSFYYLAAIVFLVAPFIFITPFGPRCVFASYIFMVLLSLELLAYLMKDSGLPTRYILKPLIPLVLVTVLFLAFVFSMNGATSRERLAYLQEQVDQKEQKIELLELPFPQFHWMPSPQPKMYHTKTFKMYYDVPKDTELIIVPFERWNTK